MRTMKRFMTEVLAALLICSMVVALQPAYAADQEVKGLQEVEATVAQDDTAVVVDESNFEELKGSAIAAQASEEPIVAKGGWTDFAVGSYIEQYISLSSGDNYQFYFTPTRSSMVVTVINKLNAPMTVNLYETVAGSDSIYKVASYDGYVDYAVPTDGGGYIRYDGLDTTKEYCVMFDNKSGSYAYGDALLRVSPTSITSYTVSVTNRVYNGKASLPTTKVYYKDNTSPLESSVAYTRSGTRTTVGSKTLTITAKAPFTGKVTKKYKVIPKKPTISVTKSGWYAKGSTKYFKLKWSKVSSQASGYQIQYASNSSFKSPKSVTVKSYKTTSKTIKAGKAKYYFFRIRTYKTVSGVKYYSNWSNIVSNKRVF